MVLDCCFVLFQIRPAKTAKVRSVIPITKKSNNDFRTAMFERKKSPNRLMHVYDEFECSGMLTRISHALKFSVHLKFESLRMRIRRQEETKAVHLLLIVSFDDMQRAMLTFSSIALDRMLEPGIHHLYRLKLKLFPDESTETKPYAETQRHLELLGKIIQQIVRTESTSKIWGLYARWSRIKGNLMFNNHKDSNGGNTIGDALRPSALAVYNRFVGSKS
ncbi:hypothetical protein IGI04_012149 [Brassica rapa subsp. trilocularis]|uniref:Uncharacterized protein n=1 Tax=Brassica rapa subsp. trilocularis TaxID=1813537 RepID=A0ABQ7N7I8_BRACM|nr:hypothetical protein IGI04_012149 [Brassica rapa subsp. trilocularis]